MVISPNREVKIVQRLLLNSYSTGQIPTTWSSNPKFSECYHRMLYAQCFIRAGVRYYKSDDKNFRCVLKTRTRVFILGTDTNSHTRNEVVDSWVNCSFKPDDTNFIVDYK